jgi:hypothetical protein
MQPGRFSGKVSASGSPVGDGASPSYEQIAVLAYHLWETHGRRAGADQDDWFQAERLLLAKNE